MDILEQVGRYYYETEKRVVFLENELANAPNGTIRIHNRSGKKHYYHRTYDTKRFSERRISQADRKTITSLAKKRYIRKVLPFLKQNLHAARQFLLIHSGRDEMSIAGTIPAEITELIEELYVTPEEKRRKWLARNWTERPKFESRPQFKTLRGDHVRSKSEAFIADALFRKDLPYHYEKPLFLEQLNYPLFPDFTIYDPYSDKELYWEHFGMMEDPSYAEKACRKLSRYLNAGLIPGHGLICTFETVRIPIGSYEIETMIDIIIGSGGKKQK